jgi:catechol 2,3-dioxygenase-like lactoylglutathione lyase family enzyme
MAEYQSDELEGENWPRGVGVITLFVENLEDTKGFYHEVFGLPVHYEDADSAVFDFGNTLVNLLSESEAHSLIDPVTVAQRDEGSRLLLTVYVEDVDAMCTKLTARGVELVNGPMDRPWGVRTASFLDPGGHIWELAQRQTAGAE